MFHSNPRAAHLAGLISMLCLPAVVAAAPPARQTAAAKYLLRYKFQPGETLRWEVEHRALVRTAVNGTTQEAETISSSVKAWKVQGVDEQGAATFTHMVESVDMRQRMSDRQEVRYNSQTDDQAPPGFQDAAQSVGVPLATIRMDASGKVLDRKNHQSNSHAAEHLTIPLPAEPIEINDSWNVDFDTMATTRDGMPKKIVMRQTLTLLEVDHDVATIGLATTILTPLGGDTTLEAQLMQSELSGKVRFDMKRGRIISQQSEADKRVVGFQGNTSSMHYVTRFSEKLLSSGPQTAARNPIVSGPPLPPAN